MISIPNLHKQDLNHRDNLQPASREDTAQTIIGMRPTETSGSAENVRDISGENTISIDSSSHRPTLDLPDWTQSNHSLPLTSKIGTGLQDPGSSPFH